MKKQNYQLRIVITQGKEVLAEVKMRRDTLEDLPNVPSLPGTIYNMIGDLCRLQAASAETDEPTADEGDAEPAPAAESQNRTPGSASASTGSRTGTRNAANKSSGRSDAARPAHRETPDSRQRPARQRAAA